MEEGFKSAVYKLHESTKMPILVETVEQFENHLNLSALSLTLEMIC